ncbi:MAG: hypothetical protein LUD72_06615 [Bacteroidales bacterium]|nr:hypothetical protein [Bacteroidales bacterium]
MGLVNDEDIERIYNTLADSLSGLASQLAGAMNESVGAFTELARALGKCQVNNWRKFHGMPMKRRRRR